MVDRPLLMSAPMVLATIREVEAPGTGKTQTRRIIKPQPPRYPHYGRDIMDWGLSGIHQDEDGLEGTSKWLLDVQTDVDDHSRETIDVRFAKGDRLYVRESFMHVGGGDPGLLLYRATWREDAKAHGCDNIPADEPKGWKPGIHLPRKLSRLTLTATDVRVERLNDCTEGDALAEGVVWSDKWRGFVVPTVEHPNKDFPVLSRPSAREMYAALWDVINGSGSWLANPWIVAVTFRPELRNIDATESHNG